MSSSFLNFSASAPSVLTLRFRFGRFLSWTVHAHSLLEDVCIFCQALFLKDFRDSHFDSRPIPYLIAFYLIAFSVSQILFLKSVMFLSSSIFSKNRFGSHSSSRSIFFLGRFSCKPNSLFKEGLIFVKFFIRFYFLDRTFLRTVLLYRLFSPVVRIFFLKNIIFLSSSFCDDTDCSLVNLLLVILPSSQSFRQIILFHPIVFIIMRIAIIFPIIKVFH